jgi:hypothetical protein
MIGDMGRARDTSCGIDFDFVTLPIPESDRERLMTIPLRDREGRRRVQSATQENDSSAHGAGRSWFASCEWSSSMPALVSRRMLDYRSVVDIRHG